MSSSSKGMTEDERLKLADNILSEHEKYRIPNAYSDRDGSASKTKVTRYDVINANAFVNIKKSLDIKYLDVATDYVKYGNTICRTKRIGSKIHVIIRCDNINNNRSPTCHPMTKAGSWINIAVDERHIPSGNDIVSLICRINEFPYLEETINNRNHYGDDQIQEIASKFSWQSSPRQAVAVILERLEIDIESPTINQWSARKGWAQVTAGAQSPSCIKGEMGEEPGDHWAGFDIEGIPFIGEPSKKFEIKDKEGKLQQVIGYWETAWVTPILLSFTLWEKDEFPKHQKWFFLRSSSVFKTCPYGLDTALNFPDAAVVIGDDLDVAQRRNQQSLEDPKSLSMVFVAWPRQLYDAKPTDNDWTSLKGRNIVCAVYKDKESIQHALSLVKELEDIGARSIKVVMPRKFPGYEKDDIKVDYETGELKGTPVSIHELKNIAEELGAVVQQEVGRSSHPGWQKASGIRHKERAAEFLIKPLMWKGMATILFAPSGHGKSFLALLIGCLIAGGGSFLKDKWSAPTARKVLYLASEMGDQLDSRKDGIIASLNLENASKCIDIYHNTLKYNLSEDSAWKSLDALIEGYDFVIIDNLLGFLDGKININSWSRLWSHIETLKKKGMTVLIVQHAGSESDLSGTVQQKNPIDLLINIEKKHEHDNFALVRFMKYRDDVNLGKELGPFTLCWEKSGDEGKPYRWWVKESECDDGKPETSRDKKVETRASVIDTHFTRLDIYISKNNLGEREQAVLTILSQRERNNVKSASVSDVSEALKKWAEGIKTGTKSIPDSKPMADTYLKTLELGGHINNVGTKGKKLFSLSEKARKEIF